MSSRHKKDNNHNDIFTALRRLVPVRDLYRAGEGIVDGAAWVNGGWQFFDVKNPLTSYGKNGLNSAQRKWAEQGGGPVYLIYDLNDVQNLAAGRFDMLKQHGAQARMTAAEFRKMQK